MRSLGDSLEVRSDRRLKILAWAGRHTAEEEDDMDDDDDF